MGLIWGGGRLERFYSRYIIQGHGLFTMSILNSKCVHSLTGIYIRCPATNLNLTICPGLEEVVTKCTWYQGGLEASRGGAIVGEVGITSCDSRRIDIKVPWSDDINIFQNYILIMALKPLFRFNRTYPY